MSAPLPEIGAGDVLDRLEHLRFPPLDAVVAIERGGLVPGELTARHLGLPMGRMRIRYRDDANVIAYPRPVVNAPPEEFPGEHLLVVDDVSVTGATLRAAARALAPRTTTTLVMIGQADMVAFPEIHGCVTWTWKGRA